MNATCSPLKDAIHVTTVTLNTAVDRTLELANFEVGTTRKARTLGRIPSGKGINVSRCLDDLGVPSRALGFVGEEESALYQQSFLDTQVQLDLTTVPGRTRINTTIIDPVRGSETHIREEGFEIDGKAFAKLLEKLGRLSAPGELFVFSGSLPPGISVAQFGRLLEAARAKGGLLAIDTSEEALEKALQTPLLVFKPNEEELAELVGRALGSTSEIVDAAREFAAKGGCVLVSQGEKGALLVTTADAWEGCVRLTPSEFKNSVGAGDALLAGFLAGWLKGEAPPEMLKLAVAAGAAGACNTTSGHVPTERLPELMARAQVKLIN